MGIRIRCPAFSLSDLPPFFDFALIRKWIIRYVSLRIDSMIQKLDILLAVIIIKNLFLKTTTTNTLSQKMLTAETRCLSFKLNARFLIGL